MVSRSPAPENPPVTGPRVATVDPVPELLSTEVVVVQGFCVGEATGRAITVQDPDPDAEPGDTVVAPVTSEPVALAGQAPLPMLRALAAHGHVQAQKRTTLPDATTGYYAIPALATNDPDAEVYGGRKITLPDGTFKVIQVPYNAPSITVSAAMAAQTGLAANSTVRAIWFTEAAEYVPPEPVDVAYYTADQVDSIVAGIASPQWAAVQNKPTFAAVATSGSASDLTTGTVPDARLASTIARQSAVDAKVDRTLVDAKGDMLVGSGDDTLVRVPVGSDGRVWTADSTVAAGASWQTLVGGGGGGSGSPDIPEYSRLPVTAAIGTPTDLLTKVVGYTTNSAISQALPLAQPGRYLAVRWDAGTAALTLTGQSRTDTATVTSGSSSVADTAIQATDQGRLVTGTGIPAGTYVGTVTPGTSFLLSSSPATQTPVNATASSTQVTVADTIGESTATSFVVPVLGDVHVLHCTYGGSWRTILGHKRQASLDARNDTRYMASETGTAFRAANTTAQAIPNTTDTVISFPTVTRSSSLVTPSTQGAGHKFTLNRAGVWIGSVTVRFPSAASGEAFVAVAQSGVGTVNALGSAFGGATATRCLPISGYFDAGASLFVSVFQSSGGSQNIDHNSGNWCHIDLNWIRP